MARKSRSDKIIDKTLKLVKERGWARLKLSDIATATNISLSELRAEYELKSAILAAFMARVDGMVLDSLDEEPDVGELPRDRIFDIVMRRLEILEPYKPALKAISKDIRDVPADWANLCSATAKTQNWMLVAAGLEDHGLRGFIKINGLAMVYGRVMRVWLEDDDPGLARTMAELDRNLRRGETALKRAETPIALASAFLHFGRSAWRQRGRPPEQSSTGPQT